ncbi:Clathrin coat assembly protein ap-1 [Heracleum sosnowskyi]|uniref:Clathrin coat assembly protein ap-1 n=1 Tax=Heracleum sosnowskyi TaxID=360622 RepID=A0AAD8MHT0_9APIA|nr:Clathrin coat assembly protein ap-1 [Heracleum sosnowskyi]
MGTDITIFILVFHSIYLPFSSSKPLSGETSHLGGSSSGKACKKSGRDLVKSPQPASSECWVPTPYDATNPRIKTSPGSTKYAPEKDAMRRKIKSFPGNKECMLDAEFKLPDLISEEESADRKAPIILKFEMPYFTVSGIQVRHLKFIEKSGYQPLSWVRLRYMTMADEYELRLV